MPPRRVLGIRTSPTLLGAALIAAVGLTLVLPGAVSVAFGLPAPVHPLSAHPATAWMKFPNASAVFSLASTGTDALAALQLNSGLYQLVLFDGLHNRSRDIPQTVPTFAYPNSIAGAGGVFLVQWINDTTFRSLYERVTLGGNTSTVRLPLSASEPWTLFSGNASVLFASSPGHLVAIDPATLTAAADYSASIPSGVTVESVASVGTLLYLAGTIVVANSTSGQPFAAILNTSSGALLQLTSPSSSPPSGLSGEFDSAVVLGTRVYFAGAQIRSSSSPLTIETAGGYLYIYQTLTGAFGNSSSTLPYGMAVFGAYPAPSSIVLNLAKFVFRVGSSTATLTQRGLTDVQSYWGGGANDSKYTGSDFVALSEETASSGGFYFVGGTDTGSNTAQLDAVRLSVL